ncbi:hypothetical protein FOCC_FOCC002093 [Frankliniella occidentalis]|nr:hypothetical protein FOCC_FOCC002093 [Frankliniella occidentalis]
MDPVTGRFRNLAKLAHQLMGQPATSAGSERVFSKAGFVMQARRNRLAPQTVDNVLFLHCGPGRFSHRGEEGAALKWRESCDSGAPGEASQNFSLGGNAKALQRRAERKALQE